MPRAPRPLPPGPPRNRTGAGQFLMCRPTHYRIAYEINPWMRVARQADHKKALLQWNALHALLSKKLGVSIRLLPPHRGVPDLVFTANAGLVAARAVICSNFRHRQRQKEEPILERYFQRLGYRVLRLSPKHNFEGEGDALWVGRTLLLGFRFRSDATAHMQLSAFLKARVLPVELVDKRFYHLDTCFAPLSTRSALWFPGAFDRYGRRVIRSLVPDLLAVSEKDAQRFICNTIVIGRSLVMPAGASSALKKKLARRRFRVYEVELSEFLKAGGAAKCLVLRLN